VSYEEEARRRLALQRAAADAEAARKEAELRELLTQDQARRAQTREALREWVGVAARERLPTETLVLRPGRLGGLLGGAEVCDVWTLSDYTSGSPAESGYLMSPAVSEGLGTAIGHDGRLYSYRRRGNRSELYAVRDSSGRLSEASTPSYDQQTLELMFEAVLDGWWSHPHLLKDIKREGDQDRWRFRPRRS
jgi:hypothetical protein